MPIAEGGTRLRQLLEDPNHLVVCPGVYDGLSARIAIAMGFEAIYMVSVLTLSTLLCPYYMPNYHLLTRHYSRLEQAPLCLGSAWPISPLRHLTTCTKMRT